VSQSTRLSRRTTLKLGVGASMLPLVYIRSAGAAGKLSGLHVVTLFDPSYLWHMTHNDDPTTPWDTSNLQKISGIPGTAFLKIACATNQNDDLQVCSVTTNGGLYHTIRQSAGTWSPWGDVIAEIAHEQSRPPGTNRAPFRAIACATNQNDALHVCAVGPGGELTHTIRQAAGTWLPWGDGERPALC
jgi:hypothetical protein